MYLYLAARDDFSCVPSEIQRALGTTEFAMELELTPERKLAREDTSTVIAHLEEKGFHLQLPADEPIETIMSRIARGKT